MAIEYKLPYTANEIANKLGQIDDKLDATALDSAIETALAEAKASGEFDGKDGKDGKDGTNGDTPYIKNDSWWIGEVNTGVKAQGIDGVDGFNGQDGDSAYDIAKKNGFDGTEEEWLNSLKGEYGLNGQDGISATHSWNGTTLTITSASGTSSANLKGNPGAQGEKGDAGEDGISVVKSEINTSGELVVTYSNNVVDNLGVVIGAQGEKGQDGYTPIKGTDYWTEVDKDEIKEYVKDEIPTNISELINDTGYLTSVPNEYITETELNAKGYLTEVALTPEQLGEIANEVVEKQRVDVVDSIEEMIDTTKRYILSTTGTLWEYKTVTTIQKKYNNLFKPSEAQINKRISSSEITDYTGFVISNEIDLKQAIQGNKFKEDSLIRLWINSDNDRKLANGNSKFFYKYCGTNTTMSDRKLSPESQVKISSEEKFNNINIEAFTPGEVYSKPSGITTNEPTDYTEKGFLSSDYSVLTLSFQVSTSMVKEDFIGTDESPTDNIIITLDEQIKTEEILDTKWVDTKVPYTNGVSEERVEAVEEDVETIKTDIENLETKIENIGTTNIPSYWEEEILDKTQTVKEFQTLGGKNCVSFVWASDTHIPDSGNDNSANIGRTKDLGKLMAKMLNDCEIPFAILSGDINTRGSRPNEASFVASLTSIPEHLAPLWNSDRLLVALGNHDGCYGDGSVDETKYYRKQFKPERMWQTFFRGQALDFRRVFSEDGLYYYVDNIPQKTRFIVLNSHFGGEYEEDENGYSVNDRFHNSCYGQAQLNWFANIALDMPEGYGAIIVAHAPPNINYTLDREQLIGIINAYCNRSSFELTYTNTDVSWSTSTVKVDFSGAKGDIIAMFAGHVHWDRVDTVTMKCPIITIIAAGATPNTSYKGTDEVVPEREFNTATETSFDVVTINKDTKTIYCTRVGAGESREIQYQV